LVVLYSKCSAWSGNTSGWIACALAAAEQADWLSEPAGLTLSNGLVAAPETSVRVSGREPRTRYVLRNLVQVPGEDGLDTYAVSVPIDCVW
jgi:hypothetical protein